MASDKRVIVIVLDGLGVGELPDAGHYGDQGSDTLGNLARAAGGLFLPNLAGLGLGRLHKIQGLDPVADPAGSFGRMAEQSKGKDSTTGHWELGGLVLNNAFPTYPEGFPGEVISEFTRRTGYDILGNYAASGTEIIKELGEEHLRTGKVIVYTSADSVFQIAAHEDLVPLEELYKICRDARELLHGEHEVARIIARPFTGADSDSFQRTKYRKDFSLKPPGETILRRLQKKNIPTIGIGKINDLYAYDGLDKNIITKSNAEGMRALSDALEECGRGLIMANLVDFDMLWGHRNDVRGMRQGLEIFDKWLGGFLHLLDEDDCLFLTADHGNDPTTPSTDHSREYVPILTYGRKLKAGVDLGTRSTFADLAATVAEIFNVGPTVNGESFFGLVWK